MCVPLSRLAESILRCQALVRGAGILAPLVGHVGDSNFHLILVLDPSDPGEMDKAARVVDDMVNIAHSLGGTCTGEHGIGYGKLHHMEAEHGGRAPLDVMHAIKRALDPRDIMNPGKLGSDPVAFGRHR